MRFQPKSKLVKHKQFYDYIENKKTVPINIEVSVSGICNAKCPWCFYGNNLDNILIDPNVLKSFLAQAYDMGVNAISWTGGGEPTCHPKISEFVDFVKMKQGLFTNALAKPKYDPTKLEWIRVSKTDKKWNIENLKILRDCKTLGLCINYTGDDEIVMEALEVAEKVNVDYVQVRPALNVGNVLTDMKPPNIDHPLLLKTKYKFEEANVKRQYDKCRGFHFVPFIWENGNVDVCAYQQKDNEYNLGNIYKNSFSDIVNKFPEHVAVNNNCQTCCKNNEINSVLDDTLNIEDGDFV